MPLLLLYISTTSYAKPGVSMTGNQIINASFRTKRINILNREGHEELQRTRRNIIDVVFVFFVIFASSRFNYFFCHCEQSEAISLTRRGLLRYARNDKFTYPKKTGEIHIPPVSNLLFFRLHCTNTFDIGANTA